MSALLANENRLSGRTSALATRSAAYRPTAGPCLKPCPDPAPTSTTFSNSGWRSISRSPFELFSYWQTRVSTSGAASAGKRLAVARISAQPSAPAGRHFGVGADRAGHSRS
jgi:hypothetical protein